MSATNANAFFNADSGSVTQNINFVGTFSWLLTNSYVVGQNSSSTATVTHTSGTLRVTNSTGTAHFIIGQDRIGTYNLEGGTVVADNDSVTNNTLFFSPGVSTTNGNARIGYSATANGTAVVQGNWFVGGNQTIDLGYWSNLTVQSNTIQGTSLLIAQHDANTSTTQHWTGNTHYRDPAAQAWQLTGTAHTFSAWESATGATDAATATLPDTAQIFVRVNRYEPGRAIIVVYNWGSAAAVAVPLTAVLSSGDAYEVRNVQDIFGKVVASGTYAGGTISIPTAGVTPPRPIGGSFQPLHTTGPFFNVFVVTRS